MDTYKSLEHTLRRFAAARDWDQFHTPKNLATVLAGEAGELAAEQQWLTGADIASGLQEGPLREGVEDEAADVFIYFIRFADRTRIDLFAAVEAKIRRNERRYPADTVRGPAAKYNQLNPKPDVDAAGMTG